jgi:hypothetical protein
MNLYTLVGVVGVLGAIGIYRSFYLAWRIRLQAEEIDEIKSLCIALVRDHINGGTRHSEKTFISLQLDNLAVCSSQSGPEGDRARAEIEKWIESFPNAKESIDALRLIVAKKNLEFGFPSFPNRHLDDRLFSKIG